MLHEPRKYPYLSTAIIQWTGVIAAAVVMALCVRSGQIGLVVTVGFYGLVHYVVCAAVRALFDIAVQTHPKHRQPPAPLGPLPQDPIDRAQLERFRGG